MERPVESTVDVRYYVSAIKRRWRIVAVFAAIGVLAGVLLMARGESETFTAQASVLVRPLQANPLAPGKGNETMPSEQQVANSNQVARLVSERLANGLDETDLLNHLTVEVPLNTQILLISYEAGSKDAASKGAQTFAQTYLDYRESRAKDSIATQLDQYNAQLTQYKSDLDAVNQQLKTLDAKNTSDPTYQALVAQRNQLNSAINDVQRKITDLRATETTPGSILRQARVTSSSSTTVKKLSGVAAFALMVVLGLLVAALRDRNDSRIRSSDDLDRYTTVPLLSRITRSARNAAATLFSTVAEPESAEADAYRRLRVSLTSRDDLGSQVVLVTSTTRNEGAMAVAANLATSFAHSDRDTVLVWSDLRTKPIDPLLQAAPGTGLPAVLAGQLPLAQALVPVPGVERLVMLPSDKVDAAGRLLEGSTLRDLVNDLRSKVGVVVLVGPPVENHADALELSQLADSVVVVVRSGVTRKQSLGHALRALDQVRAPIAGTVLTGLRSA